MSQHRTPLPIIVGCGGINPAGRVSFHHAYRRLVLDSLPESVRDATLASLAQLMGLQQDKAAPIAADTRQQILDGTLVRKIEHFDVERTLWHNAVTPVSYTHLTLPTILLV